jgi:phage terminase large subunit-like protein
MKWCVGNAQAETRGHSTHITKQTSGTGKIDPLIAGFIAAKLLELNPERKKAASVYDILAAQKAATEVPNL